MTDERERPEEVREDMLDLIETRGLRAAVQAAIDVAEDKAAPAPARATAAGLILRAAALGGFGRNAERERDIEPHQMTGEQLQAAIDGLRKREAALTRRGRSRGAGDAPAKSRREDPNIFD